MHVTHFQLPPVTSTPPSACYETALLQLRLLCRLESSPPAAAAAAAAAAATCASVVNFRLLSAFAPCHPLSIASFPSPCPAMAYLDDISRCIQSSLAASDSLTSGGFFATSGPFPPLPLVSGLTVSGVGTLSFPLHPAQCRSLISVAALSPFGKGTRTLLDPAVRNSWQIDAGAITLDAAWEVCLLQTILPRVCAELGLAWDAQAGATSSSSSITYTARLYKLLIYEQGGFFAPHRDSEKEDGMFGTLVVVLPSQYTGGSLVVEHAGRQRPST